MRIGLWRLISDQDKGYARATEGYATHIAASTSGLGALGQSPLTNPADRGEQAMQFTLSPQPAGSRLLLRITPGPNQDDSWDWTYVSGFELR